MVYYLKRNYIEASGYVCGLISMNYGRHQGIATHNCWAVSMHYKLLWGMVAYSFGLLSMNYGLLQGILADYFGLLGFAGRALQFFWLKQAGSCNVRVAIQMVIKIVLGGPGYVKLAPLKGV